MKTQEQMSIHPGAAEQPVSTPKSAAYVARLAKGLSKAQRPLVERGCIHGDFTMATIRALKSKGLFHLVISSPNGRCGFMELTALGVAVQAAIRAEVPR